jgi:glycosyltransferase involved in cell wall biosynthesis
MRILTVGLLYPPHHLGGYELICEGVMEAAAARGHDVQVLVSDYRAPPAADPGGARHISSGGARHISSGGAPHVSLDDARRVSDSRAPAVHRTLRSYLDSTAQRAAALSPVQCLRLERANGAELERRLRSFAPDVVSWWGMGGMSLSLIERVRRIGLPSVLVIQDHWLSYGFSTDGWSRMARRLQGLAPLLEPLCRIPVRYQLELAGRYLYNSEYTASAASAAGFEAACSAILTPGVHNRFLASAPTAPWRWRLLHVGRVHRDKGIDIAVAALPELPAQTTLTIAGAGDDGYAAELRRQAASLGVGDRVVFAGPAPPQTLPALYADADAVLFPARWEEPWGLVPLEAMGIGRPLVATPRGGAVTYLRDGENALLIPSEDPRALAAAVRRLAGDEGLRATLRAGGMRTAAEHSASRYEHQVVDELERAARGHEVA